MRRYILCAVTFVLFCAGRVDAANCTISTTPISFGSYSVFWVAPTDSAGAITYRCNGNANVMITITEGQSGTFSPRTLVKGGEQLPYNLYLDAARSIVWGDGSPGTLIYTRIAVPNNTNVTVPVYGRIPATQDVTAGAYSDSVSVTINF